MNLSQLGAIGTFLENHGLAVFIVVSLLLFVFYAVWPFLKIRITSDAKRSNEREDTLLKRLFDTTDANTALTKEISKNMAEGNVILSSLRMQSTFETSAIENLAKRLEIHDAKGEERHVAHMQNMEKMFDMWEGIHKALVQNSGDNRNILQKHESAERIKKKPVVAS